MKQIAILGSTGSIGTQTLDVVRAHPGMFRVTVLAANSRDALLEQQIEEFQPELAVLADEAAYRRLKERYRGPAELAGGRQAFIDAAAFPTADLVVTSMMGFAGLEPTMKALDARKDIALANKETLVVAGELVMEKAREKGVSVLPVDSEHCAFYQCLQGESLDSIEKLLLTASGGPFRGKSREELQNATVEEVLAHPTWNMGKKITVDSATLMNKGLEVIEAHHLFDFPPERISVVIHPQSVVHSMVEFADGAVVAELGEADMKLPIAYCLAYPERIAGDVKRLDIARMGPLTFSEPDMKRFPQLAMAFEAIRAGAAAPIILNGANEIGVQAFLDGRIGFTAIAELCRRTLERLQPAEPKSLEDILAIDGEARRTALTLAAGLAL